MVRRVTVLREGGSDNHKLIDDLVRSGFKVMEAKRVKKSLEEVYLELVKGVRS